MAGTTVVTVGDIDHPWLRGLRQRNRSRKGEARLAGARHHRFVQGKVYNGHVSFIASEAEFTPKQIQTEQERVKLVYRIKIELDNSRRELKSNMPADGEIVLN